MTKPRRIELLLTQGEVKELVIAMQFQVVKRKSKAAKLQYKHGYRDDSPAHKKWAYARSVNKKLSVAEKELNRAK